MFFIISIGMSSFIDIASLTNTYIENLKDLEPNIEGTMVNVRVV